MRETSLCSFVVIRKQGIENSDGVIYDARVKNSPFFSYYTIIGRVSGEHPVKFCFSRIAQTIIPARHPTDIRGKLSYYLLS